MALEQPRIVFIGPGVMAEAMISGLIRKKVTPPSRIVASGPREERVAELEKRYGIVPITDNVAAVQEADVVVLSVKPQVLSQVLEELQGAIPQDALVLSIVAGAPMALIAAKLGHPYVVRAMPNTPGQIGKGISVWTASPPVTEEQRELARSILAALGEEIYMNDENYLDMATALSGTGPAYVFLFMEALVDAGVHLGFPRRIAEKLVVHTVLGSAEFYRRLQDQVHLAHLRNQVTSPGGTTASALYYLEKAGFRTALSRAVWAAYVRSRELGQGGQPTPPWEQGPNGD
ncbi:MAG: pyrroline-5-carboxylate reductase [Chloroflexi bacterium]|nr:pyrroline-5-carboxylate reductase [Chloroflexota bacterium]